MGQGYKRIFVSDIISVDEFHLYILAYCWVLFPVSAAACCDNYIDVGKKYSDFIFLFSTDVSLLICCSVCNGCILIRFVCVYIHIVFK